jgi:SMC interacting uncharacterized protein involved in chromosome segregation
MRKLLGLISVVMILVIGVAAQSAAPAPSLGDFARQQRATKKASGAKVYTNEDVAAIKAPLNEPTITPPPEAAAADNAGKTKQNTAAVKNAESTATPELSSDRRYQKELETEQVKVQTLQKELDELKRQIKIQSTNYYMDPGSRLRDPKAWTEQRTRWDEQIAAKEKALEDARAKSDGLSEQIRKMGVPTGSPE